MRGVAGAGAVALTITLAAAALTGCGGGDRRSLGNARAGTTAAKRTRLRLAGEDDLLFAAACTPRAAICELTYGEGSHYRCVGHPSVVYGEEGYVEGATCQRLPLAATVVHRQRTPACGSRAIRLLGGPPRESEETQERSDSFVLENVSRSTCEIAGYPRVTLYARARRLPFTFVPGGYYATHARPRPLLLEPEAEAFFLLAKTACEAGVAATRITVSLPGGATGMPMSSESRLGYCFPREDGPRFGDRVSMSPIVARPSERFWRPVEPPDRPPRRKPPAARRRYGVERSGTPDDSGRRADEPAAAA